MADNPQPAVRMVAPGLHVTTEQALAVSKELVQMAERNTAILRGTYAREDWPTVPSKGLGPETIGFCREMAGVQAGHGTAIGQSFASSEGISSRLAVVDGLAPAIQAVTGLLAVLRDVWGVNLSTANRGARDIYNRAVVAADSNAAVAAAIESSRTVRARAAKKAALTRRRKREADKKDPAGE